MQKMHRASVLPAVALAVVAMSSVACAQKMRCATDKDTITVTVGDRALLTYRSTPTPLKVYVKELYTPGGLQVLLDSPHDHIHHHALMYAVGAGGVDFWADEPKDKVGKQRPRSDAAAPAILHEFIVPEHPLPQPGERVSHVRQVRARVQVRQVPVSLLHHALVSTAVLPAESNRPRLVQLLLLRHVNRKLTLRVLHVDLPSQRRLRSERGVRRGAGRGCLRDSRR